MALNLFQFNFVSMCQFFNSLWLLNLQLLAIVAKKLRQKICALTSVLFFSTITTHNSPQLIYLCGSKKKMNYE